MPSQLDATLAAAGQAKVLVVLKKDVLAAASAAATENAIAAKFTAPSPELSRSLAAVASRHASRGRARPMPKVKVFPHLGLAIGFADKEGVAALRADRRVSKVEEAPELSLIRPTTAAKAKAPVQVTWGLKRLGIPAIWKAGYTGKGVLVGHLDTGIDGKHASLKSAIAAFAEFDMSGNQVPGAKPWDSGDHGTHTAGTIAARWKKAGKVAFGVAPGAKLASAMVIEGGQVIDRILAGMDWVVGRQAKILSMSLGLRGFTPAFQALTDALRAAGVLPVFAVGNEGPVTSRSPGNYHNVLSVGALDTADEVADFSSSQKFNRPDDPLVPDIVAPGVGTLSCVPGGFATMSGTSMATPHVAGLAALMLQAMPSATHGDVEYAILKSCKRPKGMLKDRGNRGVPNGVKAVEKLLGHPI
jgi:subtilisin family serine protease